MELFYINSQEFLHTHDLDFLKSYLEGRSFKSEKRFVEFALGRFLVKTAAEKFYGIKDTAIVINNSKPEFEHGGLHFSITHSAGVVMAVFDKNPCGIDLEVMKPRDFKLLSARYDKCLTTAEEFYSFWTELEAGIKLQMPVCGKFTRRFQDKFMLTVVSPEAISSPPSCTNLPVS